MPGNPFHWLNTVNTGSCYLCNIVKGGTGLENFKASEYLTVHVASYTCKKL